MNKEKALKPLKYKLIQSGLAILGLSFLLTGVLVFFGIRQVSQGLVNLVHEQTKSTTEKLTQFSSSSSARIKEQFTHEIKLRWENTLKKDSASLSQMFQDNSFSQIRDFLSTVFKDDKDMLRTTFLVADRQNIVAWHYIDRNYPAGLDLGTKFDLNKNAWKASLKKMPIEIADPEVAKIIQSNSMQIIETTFKTGDHEVAALETFIPVFSSFKDLKELESEVTIAKTQNTPVGYLRYTVSLESMQKSILTEQQNLNSYISEIEAGNQAAAVETQALGLFLQNQILTFLAVAAALLFLFSFFITRYLSNKITNPIYELIQVAKKISTGDYRYEVNIRTDDEVGILATTIQDMSHAIQVRDQKLESHALNLEQLVEKRTQELNVQKAVSIQSSKMAALGEMAGGVAHEINTPLATLSLSVEILLDAIEKPVLHREALKKSLVTSRRVIERIAKIVRGLRSFSRDGSQDPMISTSAENLIHDTTSLCSEKFKNAAVVFSVSEIPADAMVTCRPTEISQVLLNLLNNSYDAINNLSDKWIHIEVKTTATDVIFSVTDSGPGIPEDIQNKIMQPFFTTKDIGKGTGLGLSISKGIIESHGGKFDLDTSKPNTSFYFQLPKTK